MANNAIWIERLKKQVNPSHSAAANYWDALQPEWRGVVLYAASIAGTANFPSSLTKYQWKDLYSQIDTHGMAQIRMGIQRARAVFEGFGDLRHSDFVKRTARRPERQHPPVKTGPEMIIAPEILSVLNHVNHRKEDWK